jgi:hypothetical protein
MTFIRNSVRALSALTIAADVILMSSWAGGAAAPDGAATKGARGGEKRGKEGGEKGEKSWLAIQSSDIQGRLRTDKNRATKGAQRRKEKRKKEKAVGDCGLRVQIGRFVAY